ncbi:hypothetical protein [Nocardia stercoris]|uniref:Ig-like domain repeat protein n=1 Tax=Nocardia stercoris TaxID=2483361 RepID=A0A3M2L1H9_9NOCA|nr:hypothetical protein [Nocardia stercoris]RMI30796.1 hypothetical protein EBN03_19215 [Nocardia stercoris]
MTKMIGRRAGVAAAMGIVAAASIAVVTPTATAATAAPCAYFPDTTFTVGGTYTMTVPIPQTAVGTTVDFYDDGTIFQSDPNVQGSTATATWKPTYVGDHSVAFGNSAYPGDICFITVAAAPTGPGSSITDLVGGLSGVLQAISGLL